MTFGIIARAPLTFGLAAFAIMLSGSGAGAVSRCVACHTSGAKLITVTRQLAASRPEVAPAKSEGEG
jgi:hypothetical protein